MTAPLTNLTGFLAHPLYEYYRFTWDGVPWKMVNLTTRSSESIFAYPHGQSARLNLVFPARRGTVGHKEGFFAHELHARRLGMEAGDVQHYLAEALREFAHAPKPKRGLQQAPLAGRGVFGGQLQDANYQQATSAVMGPYHIIRGLWGPFHVTASYNPEVLEPYRSTFAVSGGKEDFTVVLHTSEGLKFRWLPSRKWAEAWGEDELIPYKNVDLTRETYRVPELLASLISLDPLEAVVIEEELNGLFHELLSTLRLRATDS